MTCGNGPRRELAIAGQIEPDHPAISPLVRQLNAPKPSSIANRETTKAHGAEAITADELEQTVRSMPGRSVELFTTTIQPLLLNRYATTGAVVPRDRQRCILLRPTNGTPVWRRLTLRNLHELLQQIDHSQPQASKLLEMSRQPHGGGTTVPIAENSVRYRQITNGLKAFRENRPRTEVA